LPKRLLDETAPEVGNNRFETCDSPSETLRERKIEYGGNPLLPNFLLSFLKIDSVIDARAGGVWTQNPPEAHIRAQTPVFIVTIFNSSGS
jgi:hypothetical protein